MSFADDQLGRFLARVAAREPAPGGGTVAAVTAAAAAGLVAMAARFSAHMDGADRAAERADALRERAGRLADEDARAYAAVLAAQRLRRQGDTAGAQDPLRNALTEACDVPLAVVEVAVEVGEMAARLAVDGNPNLRGDAVTATLLADASARSGAFLVRANIAAGGLDQGRIRRAESACATLSAIVAGMDLHH